MTAIDIDVTEQINSVCRTVGARTLEAGEARVLTVVRSFAADVDDVWDAFTSVDRIGRWFLPITGELKVGGHYQFEGNAGGTVERCDPPRSFAVTWESGGEVSQVELRFSAEPGGRTRLELEHVAHLDAARWDLYGPGGFGIGWESGLLGLTIYLESGPEAHGGPEAGVIWAGSAQGKEFMTQASERWAAASIEAGTDEAAARAAADRTTAAYTGA